jgi:hypothetical protein
LFKGHKSWDGRSRIGGSKSKPAIEIFGQFKHRRKEDYTQGNLSGIRHEHNAIVVSIESERKRRRWNDREVMPSLSIAVVEIRKQMPLIGGPVLVLGPAIGPPCPPVSSSCCYAASSSIDLSQLSTTHHSFPITLQLSFLASRQRWLVSQFRSPISRSQLTT